MEELAIFGGKPVRENKIFYGRQYIDQADVDAVAAVMTSDYITCGPKVKELEEHLCELTHAKYAVVVCNGTAALHLAALRVAMLQTGEADIISPLPAIQVDKLKDDASLDVLNLGGLTYRYATLNKNYTLADGRKPLDDVRVRQAMNYAFDSEAYTQVVFQGYASVPTSLFASSVPYYAEQTPYTADVEKAKSLMSEAGYSDGFPINIWVDNTTIEMQGAEFLKQQLAQINIDVNVVPMESTTIADMTISPEYKKEVRVC